MGLAQVDAGELVELLWASILAGLVVAVTFAVVIRGATRASDARRAGRSAAALAYGATAVAAVILFLGTIAAGLVIIAA